VLLSEAVELLTDVQRAGVTTDILSSLAGLEAHGLYHRDLRLWNVIWDRDAGRAHLIDHGSIGTSAGDAMWPFDAHFALLTFLSALWGRRSDQTGLDIPRASRLDSAQLGRRAALLVSELMVHADDDLVFRDLSAAWARFPTTEDDPTWPAVPVAWEWLTKVENQREEMRVERDAQTAERGRVRAALDTAEEELARLGRDRATREAHHDKELAQRAAELRQLEVDHEQRANRREAEIERRELQHQLQLTERETELALRRLERDQLAVELELVRRTRSWRVTAPLRRVQLASKRLAGWRARR
jgi:hypothetical protein